MRTPDRGPRCECGALIEHGRGGPISVMTGKAHQCPTSQPVPRALSDILADAFQRCKDCDAYVATVGRGKHVLELRPHACQGPPLPRGTRWAPSTNRPVWENT